jgi:hypothetical protein
MLALLVAQTSAAACIVMASATTMGERLWLNVMVAAAGHSLFHAGNMQLQLLQLRLLTCLQHHC